MKASSVAFVLFLLFASSQGFSRTCCPENPSLYGHESILTAPPKNSPFRIFGNSRYMILDTAGFVLYYRYMPGDQPKGAGLIYESRYFFSRDLNSPIYPLKKKNLEAVYASSLFSYLLNARFERDSELSVYDQHALMYTVQYVYKLSSQIDHVIPAMDSKSL